MSDCFTTGLTGEKYCSRSSIIKDPTAIILAKDSVSFTAEEFLVKANWLTKINSEDIFPIKDLREFTDNSTDPVYKDYADDSRVFIRQGKYRFDAMFNKNEEQKKQLQNFKDFNQGVFLVYGDIIRGRTTDGGTTIKPIRLEELVVGKEIMNPTSEVPMIPIHVDLRDYRDINEYDYAREMSWDVSDLDGLTEVDLAVVGTPTSSEIVVSVYGTAYGNNYPITGIAEADFSTDVTASATGFTDNGDGTYTFAGTGFASGTINLQAPSSMTTTTLLIKSSGAATVTIS